MNHQVCTESYHERCELHCTYCGDIIMFTLSFQSLMEKFQPSEKICHSCIRVSDKYKNNKPTDTLEWWLE